MGKKEENFLQNGGLLLEKLISSFKGKSNPIREFSEKDLIKATNNYSANTIFHKDGDCIWYKGSWEGRLISVRKFKKTFGDIILELAVKDIATAAQMGVHKNALKLLGCCLETHLPTPVYEFPINGVLSRRIRPSKNDPESDQNLTWKNRLSIAREIAHVVSYLHLAFPTPIIHRDIKLANFHLGQDCVPKISTFILSVPLPEGETYVSDTVRGTLGFIAPEYINTGEVRVKIDVFAFGVLLLELLTGRKSFSPGNSDEDVCLIDKVREHLKSHGDFKELVDANIGADEGVAGMHEWQQMKQVLGLALYCTLDSAEERPTMMEVAKQLRQIQRRKMTEPEANPGALNSLDKSLPRSMVSLSVDDDGLIQHLSLQPKVTLSYPSIIRRLDENPFSSDFISSAFKKIAYKK